MRVFLAVLVLTLPAAGQDLVAKTEALSPAEEQKAFKLPPGFTAQLVASEPEIEKPIQMAFDAKGRLWVTTSHHYPFPAADGKGTDKLFILSEFDAAGRAKKVETFDDKLNIPIGILPLPDCKSCLVSECGRILKLTDSNGDGKAEQREVLFSGFGFRDTHGMTNSFTLLPDGWVYACHGYLNDSSVKGKDSHEITMNSGNTFRFKPDGSRIEIFTHGQVNPFGITVDPWLNLYTADCHTKPITQLIRGAHYDSFNKPHDGLGYGPHVMSHLHGSTGICGPAWYQADHFPKEWNGVLFVGNPVTSRINCDRIEWKGSTPAGKELPDFLVSSDSWCRPVDLKLGPDGALYFADFYNRVIGHYEVDLRHPGRDKLRGRVWRIVVDGKTPAMPRTDWATLAKDEVFKDFHCDNLAVRLLAANEAARRAEFKVDFASPLAPNDRLLIGMGLLAHVHERLGIVKGDDYEPCLKFVQDNPALFKTEQYPGLVIRAMTSRKEWGVDERAMALKSLKFFESVRIKRAVIDGMTAHPHAEFVEVLLDFIPKIEKDDTHLRHAARVALRNCVVAAGGVGKVEAMAKGDRAAVLLDVAVAIRSKDASAFLTKNIDADGVRRETLLAAAEVIGQFDPDAALDVLHRCGASHDLAQALMRGLAAGGRKKLPEGFPDAVNTLVINSIGAIKAVPFVGTLRLATSFPESAASFADLESTKKVRDLLHNANVSVNARADFAEALFPIPSPALQSDLRKMLADPNEPLFLRSRLISSLLAKPSAEDRALAKSLLKAAPYALAVAIATGLAGSPEGAEMLFVSVKSGEASARLLQERAVLNRLRATKPRDFDARLAELTKNLPPLEKRLDDLVKARAAAFRNAEPDLARGKEVYTKQCAICHAINNEGSKIGPQLDGVGIRGLERLLEDTIDPNRNVDFAFRATKLDLKDGRSLTGLLLREEGAAYVLADALGKEQHIPKADVDEKTTLVQSAMPANIDTMIPEKDYYDLLAFLLEQRQKK